MRRKKERRSLPRRIVRWALRALLVALLYVAVGSYAPFIRLPEPPDGRFGRTQDGRPPEPPDGRHARSGMGENGRDGFAPRGGHGGPGGPGGPGGGRPRR